MHNSTTGVLGKRISRVYRTIVSLLVLCLIMTTMQALVAIEADAATVTKVPTRVINLVYDDSGSMIFDDNGKKVDTWCQAKYALEVFAAMLSDGDSMNIYVMSEYENGRSPKPQYTLDGKDGPVKNVSTVHNMLTNYANTPFHPVEVAYDDLRKVDADEKWLVILTDGAFEDGNKPQSEIDSYIASKDSNVKVMFLGMGANAGKISADESNNIYSEKAETNSEILNKLTEIGKRVFNSSSLPIADKNKIEFDVPMSELVVFAQGRNVKLNGIKNSDGKNIGRGVSPVTVQYSEKAAKNYSEKPKIDKGLKGCIASYYGDFDPGEYTVDVEGAETVEVYYKPNLAVNVKLTNSEGKEVTNVAALEAGTYTVDFGIVRKSAVGKNGKVKKSDIIESSELLGDLTYEAVVSNNGEFHEQRYQPGSQITLEEGPFTIAATARYLEYNSVSTILDYQIFKNKKITFSLEQGDGFTVKNDGIKTEKPVRIKAQIDGQDFTPDQWSKMGVPEIKFKDKPKFKIDDLKLKKSTTPGYFEVIAKTPEKGPNSRTYKDCEAEVTYSEVIKPETWNGSADVTLGFKDKRNFFVRNRTLIIRGILLLLLTILVLGYMPFIKCYLPKNLKEKPSVRCIPEELGDNKKIKPGRFERDIKSRLLPYVAEKGTLKYTPPGVSGAPKLQLKAVKNRRMIITNARDYHNKRYITFDGAPIGNEESTYNFSANTTIVVKRTGWKYTCVPSESYADAKSKAKSKVKNNPSVKKRSRRR